MVYFQGTDEIGHVAGRFVPPKLPAGGGRGVQASSRTPSTRSTSRPTGSSGSSGRRPGATARRCPRVRPRIQVGRRPAGVLLGRPVRHRVPLAPGPGDARRRGTGDRRRPRSAGRRASSTSRRRSAASSASLPTRSSRGRPVAGLGGAALPTAVAPVSWEKTAKVERLVVRDMDEAEKKAAEEFTKKLISLGYLTGSEAAAVDARPADRAGTETAGHYQNLATFLRARGKYAESVAALQEGPRDQPEVGHRLDEPTRSPSSSSTAGRRRTRRSSSRSSYGYNDPEAAAYRRVSTYMQRIERRPAVRKDLIRYLRSLVTAFPQNDRYGASLGKALFEDQQCAESQQLFSKIVARKPVRRRSPQPHGTHIALSRKAGGGAGVVPEVARDRPEPACRPRSVRPARKRRLVRPMNHHRSLALLAAATAPGVPCRRSAAGSGRREAGPLRSAGRRGRPCAAEAVRPARRRPEERRPEDRGAARLAGGLLPVRPRRADARRPRRREDPGLEALPRREEVLRRRAGQRPGLRPRRRHGEDGPRRRRLRRRGAPEGAEADRQRVRPRLPPRAPRTLPEGPVQDLLRPFDRPALVQGPEDPARDRLRRLRHLGLRLLLGRRAPPRRASVGPGSQLRRAAAGHDPARRGARPGPGRRRGDDRRVLRHAVPLLQEEGGRPRRPRPQAREGAEDPQGLQDVPDLRAHLGLPGGLRRALLLREGQGRLLQLEVERLRPAGNALRRRARHLRPRLRRRQRHLRGGVPLLLPSGERRDESSRRPVRGLRGPGPVDADLFRRRRSALLVLRQPHGGVPPQDLPEGSGASAAPPPRRAEGAAARPRRLRRSRPREARRSPAAGRRAGRRVAPRPSTFLPLLRRLLHARTGAGRRSRSSPSRRPSSRASTPTASRP